MLKIEIRFGERFLVTSFNEKQLRWPYSVWNTIPKERTENIFGAINAYLETLSPDIQAGMWSLYEQAFELCSIDNNKNTENRIVDVLNGFEKYLDFNTMHRFFVEQGYHKEDLNDPVTNNTNNSDAMTILRHEALEFCSFSNVVKLFTPIIGTRVHLAKRNAGNLHKEIVACKPFNRSKFTEWSPYCRLQDYLAELAKNRAGTVDPALTCGLPLSSLEDFLMGLTLARRLAVMPLKHPTDNGRRAPTMVAYMYTFLDVQIKTLKNGAWKDKGIGKESERGGQEADSVSDSYRVSQDLTDDLIVEAEVALIHYGEINAKAIGLDTDEDLQNVKAVFSSLIKHNGYTVENDFQLVIPALILRKIISPVIFYQLSREARIAAISLSAVKVLKLGYEDIYELLIAVREEKQLGEMEMNMQNDHQFLKLRDELQERLIECYPHRRPVDIRDKTCPGITVIKNIMDVVKSHKWVGLENPNNLRNSIASLIIGETRQC